MAGSAFRGTLSGMNELSPIVSEFATQEEADAYLAWLERKVAKSLAEFADRGDLRATVVAETEKALAGDSWRSVEQAVLLAVALEHRPIHLDTQARARGNVQPAVALFEGLQDQMLAERMRRTVVLEDRLLRKDVVMCDRDGCDHLKGCRLGDRRAPHVRVHLHAVRMRQRDHVPACADAPHRPEVRLSDVHATLPDQFAKAEQGVLVLAAGGAWLGRATSATRRLDGPAGRILPSGVVMVTRKALSPRRMTVPLLSLPLDSRNLPAQPGFSVWRPRPSASASAETLWVMTLPAPTMAPRPTFTGATSTVFAFTSDPHA